ncbi:MAG: glycosyltransferase family 39 protein [Candidatus Brocadiia bacterium]
MTRWQKWALVLLVVAGGGARLYLALTAAGLNADGPRFAMVTQRMAEHGVGRAMRGDYMWPYLPVNTRLVVYPFLGSLLYRLTGDAVLSLRLVSAASGTALIIMAFVLGRRLLGSSGAALFCAFLVGFEPEFLRASAAVYREVTAALVVALALYLALRAFRSRELWPAWAMALGTAVFVGFLTRVELALLPLAAVGLGVGMRSVPWRRRLLVPITACLVLAVMAAPYALWLRIHTGRPMVSQWQMATQLRTWRPCEEYLRLQEGRQ